MFFLRLISKLPLRILYLLSDLLFIVGYYLIRYRRDVVAANLARSFPEKTPTALKVLEKQFYQNFCDYPLETLKQLTMSEAELKRRMVFRNPEILERMRNEGRSVICITSHHFNWEWLVAGVTLLRTHPMHYVYQPQSSEFFDRLSNLVRMRFGARHIKRDEVARELVKLRKNFHALAIVADQFPGHPRDKKYWTHFLQQETAFYESVQQIASISNDVVIFFGCRRVRRGYFECDVEVLTEPPYRKGDFNLVESYVRAVERNICRQPDGWLWTHNRWKMKRD